MPKHELSISPPKNIYYNFENSKSKNALIKHTENNKPYWKFYLKVRILYIYIFLNLQRKWTINIMIHFVQKILLPSSLSKNVIRKVYAVTKALNFDINVN